MLIALLRLVAQWLDDVGVEVLVTTDEAPKFLPTDAKVFAIVYRIPLPVTRR